MELVLTPEETAVQLGLETHETLRLFESGRLSAFRVGEDWRITPAALRADLERIHLQISPAPPVVLGPRSETPFRVAPTLRPVPSKLPERREFSEIFTVRILVENDSDYSGEFALYLATEGSNDRWDVQHAAECERVDSELLVRQNLNFDETITLFVAKLHGRIGDRLFLAVPGQPAVTEEFERVYVLQDNLSLRLTLTNRGVFGKRRAVKAKELARRDDGSTNDAPETTTAAETTETAEIPEQ